MHQLDEFLVGANTPHHFGPHGLAANLFDEFLHHRQADVGFKQGPADLLEGPCNVGLADGGLAPQAFDGVFKPLG